MKLTKPQQLVYEMECFAGGTVSNICGSILFRGIKDTQQLVGAAREILRQNEALRMNIREHEGSVDWEITEYEGKNVEVLHFKNKEEMDVYANACARKPMDLFGILCTLKVVVLPDRYGLLIQAHHMVADAWSLTLIGNQFSSILKGETLQVFGYSQYCAAEEKYLQSQRYAKDRKFFLEQFRKCDEVTYLSEKQSVTLCADRKTCVIEKELAGRLLSYTEQKETSPFALFLTVLSVYFYRVKMNTENFYIGTAVLNRNGFKEKNTMGMYINTVPVGIELAGNESFENNLKNVTKRSMEVMRHQKYNYGDLLKDLRKEFHFTEKLYDVIVSYQNARLTQCEACESSWYTCGKQSESLQIHIDDRDDEGIFRIHYDYQTEKYTEKEVQRLHGHLMNILEDAMEHEEKKLYELELLSPKERQELLFHFNDTAAEYSKDKCVNQLFEEQAATHPEQIAVIACDRTLTYGQLNEQANRIAFSLLERGVQVGDIVPFILLRRSHLIAAMLGILKAGAAYLPVDPDYPQDRIDFMMEDSGSGVVITEENIGEYMGNEKADNPQVKMNSESLCYCIYTSGSTGKPKGTLLKHRNVVAHVSYINQIMNQLRCQRMASITTVGFDPFVTESIGMLANGKEVLLANEEQAKIPSALNQMMQEYGADFIQATPTKVKMLAADKKQLDYIGKLKWIGLGGEVLEKEFVKQLRTMTAAQIVNVYGPTETTVLVTSCSIADEKDITIGKPVANTQIYIVDTCMQPVPYGVNGELCIAGELVGAGYLHRPELTAEKFVDNPFGKGKMYKSGDLACWREDGNIEFVGRNDFQVKIRGLRIELGEIENALISVDGVTQAVVVVRKNDTGRQVICAFYTGREADGKELRSVLGGKLPRYMVPHVFTWMEEMPLTASGKISRRALSAVSLDVTGDTAEYVPPQNGRQNVLCSLLENVFGASQVGIRDDFFELGGDSLKAIEYVSKAHSEGVYFSLQNVFDHPTVEQLTGYMEQSEKMHVLYEKEEFIAVHKLLEKNEEPDGEAICERISSDVGNLLLAGATGYLGMHILADFLDKDTGTAYCIVRGTDENDSVARMRERLEFYFGDNYTGLLQGRIQVLCGDLKKDGFGLSEEKYKELVFDVDTVVNTAASVKHYGSYEYFREYNVETVEKLIEFCRQSSARLIHTSTLSVSGSSFAEQEAVSEEERHFGETNLYIGQNLDNVYARSKFEGEKLVLEATARGLQACIMRMGNLTNRMDGKFQKNYESNAFLKRMKAFLDMGMYPDYLKEFQVEFTPADEAACAVMTLARHLDENYTVFHINNSHTLSLETLMEYFKRLGYSVRAVDGKTFSGQLRSMAQSDGMTSVFEAFINDMDEKEHLNYAGHIIVDNAFTVKVLEKLGFQWQETDFAYIRRYVEYFREIGFFKKVEQ